MRFAPRHEWMENVAVNDPKASWRKMFPTHPLRRLNVTAASQLAPWARHFQKLIECEDGLTMGMIYDASVEVEARVQGFYRRGRKRRMRVLRGPIF